MGHWSESGREIVAQTVAVGPEDGLQAVGHADLSEDVRQVGLHGLLADAKALCDQLVRQPVEQQREYLPFARRDPLERSAP
jgi:hypothetical protein